MHVTGMGDWEGDYLSTEKAVRLLRVCVDRAPWRGICHIDGEGEVDIPIVAFPGYQWIPL